MLKNHTIRAYTDNDYDFVYETKKIVYKKYVEECWGAWDDEKQRGFFVDFISAYAKDILIIMVDGKRVGFYHCENLSKEEMEIGNIYFPLLLSIHRQKISLAIEIFQSHDKMVSLRTLGFLSLVSPPYQVRKS